MIRIIPAIIFLSCLLSASMLAQTPRPTPPSKDDNGVVVITTNLIQVDATVTDKNGRIVTDLKAEDFEIYENGVLQPITNFSVVTTQRERKNTSSLRGGKTDKNALPLPPVPVQLRPEQVRRTMALVVDDLGLSFGSVKHVRDALRRFVDEQMQEGDLVAIVRTGGGMGALQQFTSDKRVLYAAIEKIRFNLNGRVGVSSFEPIRPTMKEELNASMNAATGETRENVNPDSERVASGNTAGTDEDRAFDIGLNEFREDAFTVGTLGAVSYVIRGMREMPGRKAVTLFSEGFSLMERGSNLTGINSRVEGNLRRLTDLANRSSVVIYAIDPRGLVPIIFSADDTRLGIRDNPSAQGQDLFERERALANSQQSLQYLSEETGGFAVINQNNLNNGVEKILEDQTGYYLLAYQPDDDVFDPAKRRFNKLEVKLKRPGLKVRFRSGFFGISDSERRSDPKTSEQLMLEAMLSPFASGQIHLNLTSYFATDFKKGLFMRSLIHVKGDDLKFVEGADGWQAASFEVLAVTFGDNGQVIDSTNRVETIKAKPEALREIKEKGLVYTMIVPIKDPGAYQLRIALRDTATKNIGSASEFIEVPNLKKKRMVLSGLVMESSATREKRLKGEDNIVQSDLQRDIAVRRFSPGTTLMFGASVYNAKNNPPRLTTQYRLFRENRQVFVSPQTPLEINAQTDPRSIDIGGAFEIGNKFPTGNYVLQVIVRDLSASGKDHIATQWIDFEIVK